MKIAKGFTMDPDYLAGRSLALLGKKGSGKTYGMRVLAEEFYDAGVQTVIIDPVGVFWGLRSSRDGRRKGLPIPVFGGSYGDSPLEHTAGELMADLAVTEGLSMILDLSTFTSRNQERQFAMSFLDRLYRSNKERNLIHVMVDEADLFSPQRPRPQDAPLLAIMENLVRRGRNFGIGTTLATQRPAVLSKDVLTQVDALVTLRMTGPQDRDAIKSWVSGQGDDEAWATVAPSLPGLSNGEAWWWVPEKQVLERVQMRQTRTFDSSPTRTRGAQARAPKEIADVDLSAIASQIAATVERAKANDPKELRKQVKDLLDRLDRAERDLSRARDASEPQVRTVVETKVVTQPVEPKGLRDALVEAQRYASHLSEVIDSAKALLDEVEKAPRQEEVSTTVREPVTGKVAPRTKVRRAPQEPVSTASTDTGDAQVSPARQRLLEALYGLERIGIDSPRKTQLALWAGVSPKSSGYANNLGALRTVGLIDYLIPGTVSLTPQGRAMVDPSVVPDIPDDDALHDRIRSLVSPARWRLLSVLVEQYPDPISREDLAERAGVSAASSGFANNLGALRSLGLLDYPSPRLVVASDLMFLDAP